MRLPVRVQEAIYRVRQTAWSARARLQYGRDFDRVARFCLFVGYPRSGHSIVGACINAHRDAVIAHELNAPELILAGCTRAALYARILARAEWFNRGGNTSNYDYQIPHQWQGRFDTLRVIGDKRGGAVTRSIAAHPAFLARVRTLVGVPLRLVHVVRNPFDNISAISIWNHLSLTESADFYFRHCQTTSLLGTLCEPGELTTIHHEEMLRDPRTVLTGLIAFLGLELYPGYLENCCSVVFGQPTYTRRKVDWPATLVRAIERQAREYRFLDGYGFAATGDVLRQAQHER